MAGAHLAAVNEMILRRIPTDRRRMYHVGPSDPTTSAGTELLLRRLGIVWLATRARIIRHSAGNGVRPTSTASQQRHSMRPSMAGRRARAETLMRRRQ